MDPAEPARAASVSYNPIVRHFVVVRPVAGLAVTVLTLLFPAPARAQEARGYLGGGLAIWPWQPESNSSGASLSFGNTTDDAWVPAAQVEAGAFLGRHFGVGVEAAWPARRDVEQTYSYGFGQRYIAAIRYREAPLFGVIRVHPTGRPTGVSFVAGAGAVRQDGIERRRPAIGFTGTYGPFGPEVQATRWTWGATAGVDAAIPLGPRVSLVPQARAVFVERGETFEATEFADLGLPALSYRLALTLRATF
jgi:hypothetical protein